MLDIAKVLLVDDNQTHRAICNEYLGRIGYDCIMAGDGGEALEKLRQNRFDAVLLDLGLPDVSGVELLQTIKYEQPNLPVIVITANNNLRTAVECMQLGAFDFIEKPASASVLQSTVKAAARQKFQRRRATDEKPKDALEEVGLIAESPAMQEPLRWLKASAEANVNVMITGESGTGKEVFAQGLHQLSSRRRKPYIAINCGAIPKDLLESELFGHKKGSFTGAIADRKGAAQEAAGGTLFLDEIGEMDIGLQVKLLRFLQTRTFKSVGSNREETVDVRIISATNRDPLQSVDSGLLREDLYYRLNVIQIPLPPLRERGHDIVNIATQTMRQISEAESQAFEGFSKAAQQRLKSHHWPGNVRELINVLQATRVFSDKALIDEGDLIMPGVSRSFTAPPAKTPIQTAGRMTLEQAERHWIEEAIESCEGNMSKAADLLGVSPSTLYRKKKEWDTD